MKNLWILACIPMLLQFSGCGGSGSGGAIVAAPVAKNGGSNAVATQKTAVVTFSVTSTATLPVRIGGITLSAYLPAGATVPTLGNNEVSSTALVAGSAAKNALMSGKYSATDRKITIGVANASGFGPGEVALLYCNVSNNTTLTENDFTSLTLEFEASSVDPAQYTDQFFTSFLTPSLNVYFQ